MRSADRPLPPPEPEAIYRDLKKGVGHERVTDANVDALIALAVRDRNVQLEVMLREWRAPCGDGSQGVPSPMAPTRGFDRENVRR